MKEKGVILPLILIIVLLGAAIVGAVAYFQLKPKTNTQPQPTQTVNQSTPPNSSNLFSACFKQYDKKFLPDNIANYQKYKVLEDAPVFKENFAVAAARIKVNWGMSGLYSRSKQEYSFIATIVDSVDTQQFEAYKVSNDNINGLPVNIGLPSLGTNYFIFSIVPDTNVLIYFGAFRAEENAREIFISWLRAVCE